MFRRGKIIVDVLMHWLTDLGSLLVTLCWIFMLIDCLTNKTLLGGRKVGWALFIFFTHVLGALVYFCLGNSYLPARLVRQAMKSYKKTYHHPLQSAKPMNAPHPYSSYQQGYQPQNDVSAQNVDDQYYDPQFEQPQASYPEMRLPPQY